jgi:hypothetical protein
MNRDLICEKSNGCKSHVGVNDAQELLREFKGERGYISHKYTRVTALVE